MAPVGPQAGTRVVLLTGHVGRIPVEYIRYIELDDDATPVLIAYPCGMERELVAYVMDSAEVDFDIDLSGRVNVPEHVDECATCWNRRVPPGHPLPLPQPGPSPDNGQDEGAQ